MMNAPKKKLDFAKPPVEEVMLGVLFKPLDRFFAPHLGEIWQEFKEFGFVHTTAQGAIPPMIESFSDQIPEPQVQISNVPDFHRILFHSRRWKPNFTSSTRSIYIQLAENRGRAKVPWLLKHFRQF